MAKRKMWRTPRNSRPSKAAATSSSRLISSHTHTHTHTYTHTHIHSFRQLVDAKYFDKMHFHRAQHHLGVFLGISADPAATKMWTPRKTIYDDLNPEN